MRRMVILSLLAFVLAGCSFGGKLVNSPHNPITEARLADATERFNAAQKIALKYRGLRPCKRSESPWSGCRDYETYQKLRVLYREVNKAFDVAEKCVRDQSSDVDCIGGLTSAAGSYYSAALATGVR